MVPPSSPSPDRRALAALVEKPCADAKSLSAERKLFVRDLWRKCGGTPAIGLGTFTSSVESFWSFIAALDAQYVARAPAEVEAMRERAAAHCRVHLQFLSHE